MSHREDEYGHTDSLINDNYVPPAPNSLIRVNPAEYGVKLAAARNSGTPEFSHECAQHGPTLFCAETGACLICLAGRIAAGKTEKVAAIDCGGDRYIAKCKRCGDVGHDIRTGICGHCGGRARSSARAEARRAGDKLYRSQCDVHGEADFFVTSGRCAQCFTSVGARRTRPAAPFDPARAEARRAGDKLYRSQCDVHGEADFFVGLGRCADCYTSAGVRRVNKRPERA